MSSYIQGVKSLNYNIATISDPNKFVNPVTKGSAIVVFIWSYQGTGTVSAISDGVNTYNQVGSKYYPSSTWSCQIFIAVNVAAGTPTLTFTNTGQYFVLQLLEYGNVTDASAVDQVAQASGASAPSVGPTPTTTATNEVVIAGFWGSGSITFNAPYASRFAFQNTLDFTYFLIEDQDVTSKAAYTATATTGDGWVGRIVTLKIGSAASPKPVILFIR